MDIDTLEQENRQLNVRNARLMTEIAIMSEFIRDLLHPEMYGHAVTHEIRDRARRVLGKAECETVAKPSVSADAKDDEIERLNRTLRQQSDAVANAINRHHAQIIDKDTEILELKRLWFSDANPVETRYAGEYAAMQKDAK